MKKYISVLALEVRSTIYKLLLILAGMTILEATLLSRAFERMRSECERWGKTLKELDYLPFSLEMVVEESHIQVVFLASLAAVAAVLLWAGSEHGKAKSRESLWRLRISPRTVFAIFSVYHVICFGMVIMTQILIVWGFDLVYRQVICSEKAPQVLFMAFQVNGFLHGLLPMWDALKSVSLLSLLLAWGMGTVYFGYIGLAGYQKGCSILLGFLTFSMFLLAAGPEARSINWWLIGLSAVCIISILWSVKGVWGYEMGET